MKKQARSSWQQQILFAAIATAVFTLAAISFVPAQAVSYKAGEKVEVLYGSSWYKAEILETKPGSYKIRYAGYDSSWDEWVPSTKMRRIEGTAPANGRTAANPSPASTSSKFNPGDRVQCDTSQGGSWKAGVVMHFLSDDTHKNANGGFRYYRVRLDNTWGIPETFDPAGQVCVAGFIRPFNDGYKEKASNRKYKIGERVEAQNYASNWLAGEITAISGEFHTVRFDNRDSRHDESVDPVRLRPVGGKTAPVIKQNAPQDDQDSKPKMAGALPSIPGTAWKIDWGKGATGYVYLFCKTARWEVVSPDLLRGAATLMGTYKVQGSTLMSRDGSAGRVTPFKMAWQAGLLGLDDGKVTMRLHYVGKTECK